MEQLRLEEIEKRDALRRLKQKARLKPKALITKDLNEKEARRYSKLMAPVRHGYSMQRLAAINSPFERSFAKKKAEHAKEYNKAY